MIELTQGQEVALAAESGEPLTRVRVGLGWDKEPTAGFIGSGAPDVDLDVTAVQFAGRQLFDLAMYGNLRTRDGSTVHLGDNLTGRGEGDDEVVTVDLGRVYERGDTLVFMVTSYQGHTLEWVRRAYCRVADEEDRELARFTLTGGLRTTGVVMATLHRDGEGWRLKAVGEGIPVRVPTDGLVALQPFL